jgi:hypothetical protein
MFLEAVELRPCFLVVVRFGVLAVLRSREIKAGRALEKRHVGKEGRGRRVRAHLE